MLLQRSTFYIALLWLLLLFCAPSTDGHTHGNHLDLAQQPHELTQEQQDQRFQREQHLQLLEHLRQQERQQAQRGDDFPDKVPDPEGLHEFVPTLPTSSEVLLGHFNRAVRFLTGESEIYIDI